MNALDEYIKNVISIGDVGSNILAKLAAPTLANPIRKGTIRVMKDGMNGVTVLDVPKNFSVVVHSQGGDKTQRDLGNYSKSLVDKLIYTRFPGSIPVAFANVIDSNSGDLKTITTIGENLRSSADEYNLAILNGENAVLGNRVTVDANLSGTMISLIHRRFLPGPSGIIDSKNCKFAYFNPNGKPVMINSDGTGTKLAFYERSGEYHHAVKDFMAMNVDDSIKLGASVKVISGSLEYSGGNFCSKVQSHLTELAASMGILGVLEPEDLTGRMKGYADGVPTYNISGSVVSTIDEYRLNNPLRPQAGDFLVSIQGIPNPRSNGITGTRKVVAELGKGWLAGTEYDHWHQTPKGQEFLKYLAQPSTIFYPAFSELIEKGLASSVYHMSGGSFNGKLARPLEKAGLFANIENLFPLHQVEEELFRATGSSLESAFETWPMGNEGMISTNNPVKAIGVLNRFGYEARVVARLESCDRTGVQINIPNHKPVIYTGL